MTWCALITAVVLVVLPATALAQGNESTTAGAAAESQEQQGEVQVGAGSTSDVTTGSSGPSEAANPTVPPAAVPFSITPRQHLFYGPGMLSIEPPARYRCELIGDDNARKCCGATARHAAEGAPGG